MEKKEKKSVRRYMCLNDSKVLYGVTRVIEHDIQEHDGYAKTSSWIKVVKKLGGRLSPVPYERVPHDVLPAQPAQPANLAPAAQAAAQPTPSYNLPAKYEENRADRLEKQLERLSGIVGQLTEARQQHQVVLKAPRRKFDASRFKYPCLLNCGKLFHNPQSRRLHVYGRHRFEYARLYPDKPEGPF